MTAGLAHSAYTFPSLESLLTKYEDLKKADIQAHVPVQHGPTTSLYYRDPDDNTVELQIDNFTTLEEATEYMRGEEFHADPFGPSFDPDAMLAALRAGTPESELLTRAWAKTCLQRNAAADMTQIERSGTTISHDSGATEPTTKRHAEQAGPSTTARSPRPPGLSGSCGWRQDDAKPVRLLFLFQTRTSSTRTVTSLLRVALDESARTPLIIR